MYIYVYINVYYVLCLIIVFVIAVILLLLLVALVSLFLFLFYLCTHTHTSHTHTYIYIYQTSSLPNSCDATKTRAHRVSSFLFLFLILILVNVFLRRRQNQNMVQHRGNPKSQFLSLLRVETSILTSFRKAMCVCHSPLAQDWPVLWAVPSVFWLSVCFVPIDLLNEISWSEWRCCMSRAPRVLMSVAWDFRMAWDSLFLHVRRARSNGVGFRPMVCVEATTIISHTIFK